MSAIQAQTRILKYTFIVFVLLSVLTVSSWFAPLANPYQNQSKLLSSRKPASIVALTGTSSTNQIVQDKKDIYLSLDLECIDAKGEDKTIVSGSSQIQLLGRYCGSSSNRIKISHSKIINKSNGYEATTFPIEGSKFITDFIALLPGENQIEIEQKTSSGKTTAFRLVINHESSHTQHTQ